VPILTKSTSARICTACNAGACNAAAGVSIMTPTVNRPTARAASANVPPGRWRSWGPSPKPRPTIAYQGRAAARAAVTAAARSPPFSISVSIASSAGESASTMVLSPGSAFPRSTIPANPARSPVARAARSSSLAEPLARPKRRKKVPYSGPLAPPTEVTSVMATVFSSSLTSAGCIPSSFSMTADMPRTMLMP
jgi:hypothetical protein